MNLLKELKPFHKQIDAFKSGYGITDTVAIQKLADIWDAFADTRKKAIYGSDSAVIPRTKTTCASCIKDMMNMLCNWREIVTREEGEKLVEFKSVKAKVEVVKPKAVIGVNDDPTKIWGEGSGIENGIVVNTDINDIEAVRKLLTMSGIKYHHKMKLPKLLELLNEPK